MRLHPPKNVSKFDRKMENFVLPVDMSDPGNWWLKQNYIEHGKKQHSALNFLSIFNALKHQLQQLFNLRKHLQVFHVKLKIGKVSFKRKTKYTCQKSAIGITINQKF